MPVNLSQFARTSPNRSSGERMPFSGGDGGGVGYMAEKVRLLIGKETKSKSLEQSKGGKRINGPGGSLLKGILGALAWDQARGKAIQSGAANGSLVW